jgi:hypothetical protein
LSRSRRITVATTLTIYDELAKKLEGYEPGDEVSFSVIGRVDRVSHGEGGSMEVAVVILDLTPSEVKDWDDAAKRAYVKLESTPVMA